MFSGHSRHTVSGDSWHAVNKPSEWAVSRKPTQLPEEETTPQGWTERRVIKAVLADGRVIVELNNKQCVVPKVPNICF